MNHIFSSLEREDTTGGESPKPALSTLLRQWKNALDSSDFSEESPTLQECTKKLLTLYYHVSIIVAESYSSQDETIFNRYTDHFQTAVELAEDITDMEGNELQGFSLLFSFDLGITPPMFLVASRCRRPLIRRRAMNLMIQSPFYHGAWQDRYSGLCAQRIIKIEEQGAGFLVDDINVPEQNRIRKISADIDETQSEISMQFRRWPFTVDAPVDTTIVKLKS